MRIVSVRTVSVTAIMLAVLFAMLPLLARAQTATSSDALSATIRAELLSDPRTAQLSQSQLDAMVQLLTQAATKQGLTPQAITWRPAPNASTFTNSEAPTNTCGRIPAPLCALNIAFGFSGSDPTLPIWLGITALLLILLITVAYEMRHRRHQPQPQPQV